MMRDQAMWHPDKYMERLYADMDRKYTFQAQNREEWESWREQLKRQFTEDLGGFPSSPASLDVRQIEQVACEGYIRERVEYTTYAGMRVPAYVLTPTTAGAVDNGRVSKRLSAVIACHGHGYGSREIVGLSPEDESILDRPTYQKNFAVELVRRGFVVIAPEILGFGDRRMKEEFDQNKHSSCDSVSTYLLHMGLTMSGLRVYDTMRAIDYLQTRDDVNPERIGCMGISGGGLIASFTSALDERIKSVVVSGFINSFKASILGMHHCVDNYIPGLGRHAESADITGLIAPRPLLMEAGTKDPIFPIAASIEAYEQIHKVYALLGEQSKLDSDIFEGEHVIHGAKSYDWLVQTLNG